MLSLLARTIVRGRAPAGDVLGWFFFVNKVHSPQYSLWIIALMAVVAVPTGLFVAFAAADVATFGLSFIVLYLQAIGFSGEWFHREALIPVTVVREGLLLGVIALALSAVARAARVRAP